jgi:hypothetical protein
MLCCGGCALLPLATLSTVFGLGSTVATTGPEVYHEGKLDSALLAAYPDVLAGVRAAANDLRFHIERDQPVGKWGNMHNIKIADEEESGIDITIERRTSAVTRCRVDVGYFGSAPTAKLVMRQIETHLPERARATTRGD